jgi:hypothetical protein
MLNIEYTRRPAHKVDCRKMQNPDGKAPAKSNPVITIGRRINQCEALLKWVDYVLIASLDLVNNPSNALHQSVSLVSIVKPTPGRAVVKGHQNVFLHVACTQVQTSIEPNVAACSRNERLEMLRSGAAKDTVDKLVWANFQWHPFPLTNVIFFRRIISPETIDAFKALNPDFPIPSIPMMANKAQKYVEYVLRLSDIVHGPDIFVQVPKLSTSSTRVRRHRNDRELKPLVIMGYP